MALNSLTHESPFCVIIYTSYKILKWTGFSSHSVYFTIPEATTLWRDRNTYITDIVITSLNCLCEAVAIQFPQLHLLHK